MRRMKGVIRGRSYFRDHDLEETFIRSFSVDLDAGEVILIVDAVGAARTTEVHTIVFSKVQDFSRERASVLWRDRLSITPEDPIQLLYGIEDMGAGDRFRFSACLSSWGSVTFDYREVVGQMEETPLGRFLR